MTSPLTPRSHIGRRTLTVTLAAIALLAFAACDSTPTHSPVLPGYTHSEPVRNLDRLAGTLLAEGPCLYARSNSGVTTLLILPLNSVSFNGDALVFNGQHYPVGNRGEWVGNDRLRIDDLDLSTEPDPTCDTTHVFVVSPS